MNVKNLIQIISDKCLHFFHVVSNVRPIIWICIYICLIPLFALIYWVLPDSQFHIPPQTSDDFGGWVYYSIVTISTLGFGDYTPVHGWAQCVSAIEVLCGLLIFGFFLNAVGSMKSEIEVNSEIEKQRRLYVAKEREKLLKNIPIIIHSLNIFLSYCYAVTTPRNRRNSAEIKYNPEFRFCDMSDLFKSAELPMDHSTRPAIEGLMRSANNTCLLFDSLQTRVDITIWSRLLESCFSFVANSQMFISGDDFSRRLPRRVVDGHRLSIAEEEERLSKEIALSKQLPERVQGSGMNNVLELYYYIKDNAEIASNIETICSELAMTQEPQGVKN